MELLEFKSVGTGLGVYINPKFVVAVEVGEIPEGKNICTYIWLSGIKAPVEVEHLVGKVVESFRTLDEN